MHRRWPCGAHNMSREVSLQTDQILRGLQGTLVGELGYGVCLAEQGTPNTGHGPQSYQSSLPIVISSMHSRCHAMSCNSLLIVTSQTGICRELLWERGRAGIWSLPSSRLTQGRNRRLLTFGCSTVYRFVAHRLRLGYTQWGSTNTTDTSA